MTLQTSGPISIRDINIELGRGGNSKLSLGTSSSRDLAEVPSGKISLSDFYGRRGRVKYDLIYTQAMADSDIPTNGMVDVIRLLKEAIGVDLGTSLPAGDYRFINDANVIGGNLGTLSKYTIMITAGYYGTVLGFESGSTLSFINNKIIRGRGGDGAYTYGRPAYSCIYIDGNNLNLDTLYIKKGNLFPGGGGGATGQRYRSDTFSTKNTSLGTTITVSSRVTAGGGGGVGLGIGYPSSVNKYHSEGYDIVPTITGTVTRHGGDGSLSSGGVAGQATSNKGPVSGGVGGAIGAPGGSAVHHRYNVDGNLIDTTTYPGGAGGVEVSYINPQTGPSIEYI